MCSSPRSDKVDSPDTGIAMGEYPGHSPDQSGSPSDTHDETPTSLASPADSNGDEKSPKLEPKDEHLDDDEKMTDEQRMQQQLLSSLPGLQMFNAMKEMKTDDKPQTPTQMFPNMAAQLSQQMPNPFANFQQLQQFINQGNNPLQAFAANFPNLPNLPPIASSSFAPAPVQQQPVFTNSGATNPDGTPAPQKRKRQRRNPVWPYFDVIDGTARCKQCLYSTKSVFSTNLKVHLRSHHRADYDKVIEAEDALNLNALLLSGNTGRGQKRQLPPMTTSILQTINKLANQSVGGDDSNPLNNVLRQTLAAGNLQQQMQQAAKNLPLNFMNGSPLQNNIMGRQLAEALASAQQAQAQTQKPSTPVSHAQSPAPTTPITAASTPLSFPPTPSTPSTPAPSSAPVIAEQFFKQFNINFPGNFAMGQSPVEAPQPKRRRLRRHPVWMFFTDLEDRMVGCISCTFRTGSAFSTNLKMHLKAHHKEDYQKVMKLEDEMRIEEGILHPNKIKSELIDFIRGGGNASQIIPGAQQQPCSPTAPRPSALVQQFISQTLSAPNRSDPDYHQHQQQNGATADIVTGCALDEATLAKLGMGPINAGLQKEESQYSEAGDAVASDLLSRLGLLQPQKEERTAMDELRKAAERLATANGNSRSVCNLADVRNVLKDVSDNKTSSSASSEGEDIVKGRRDRALARLVTQYNFLHGNQLFKEFIRTLAPEYEFPDLDRLHGLHEGSQSPQGEAQIAVHMPALLQ
ncbi:unnamed protein product, partial [Mesorhabditis spiculigera]